MILKSSSLRNTLFIDIETVSGSRNYQEMTPEMQYFWNRKARQFATDKFKEMTPDEIALSYKDKAAIFSEFGKVVCISIGFFSKEKGKRQFRVRSFSGHEEALLLQDLSDLLEKHFDDPGKHFICGHNIKEFDIPYLCRRMVIHKVKIPTILQIAGKKPWQVEHLIDTMELWKFGDYKNFTSLALLAEILGIPTPKDDIDGSMVGRVYYDEDDLDRITTYCEKDVVSVARVALHFADARSLEDSEVVVVKG